MMLASLTRPLALLVLLGAIGCPTTVQVAATPVDQEFLLNATRQIPDDLFYIPANVRFAGPLATEDTRVTRPSEAMMGGDTFVFPIYAVAREACELAVRKSFKPNDPPKEFLRDDAFEIEFSMYQCDLPHRGGAGEARCVLEITADVKKPSGALVATIRAKGVASGMIDDTGHGAGGPGVLWMAASSLVEDLCRQLRGPKVRGPFMNKDRHVAWLSTRTGRPAPPGERPLYDVEGSWGEYVPVVRLD